METGRRSWSTGLVLVRGLPWVVVGVVVVDVHVTVIIHGVCVCGRVSVRHGGFLGSSLGSLFCPGFGEQFFCACGDHGGDEAARAHGISIGLLGFRFFQITNQIPFIDRRDNSILLVGEFLGCRLKLEAQWVVPLTAVGVVVEIVGFVILVRAAHPAIGQGSQIHCFSDKIRLRLFSNEIRVDAEGPGRLTDFILGCEWDRGRCGV